MSVSGSTPSPALMLLLLVSAVLLSGCALVGGIFKAGLWVGVIAVVIVVAVVMLIVGKARG
ncbi:MAG: phosphatidate cytidylyltransferase [Acidobacteriota bacterium]